MWTGVPQSEEGTSWQTFSPPQVSRSPLIYPGSPRSSSKELPLIDLTEVGDDPVNIGGINHGTALQDPLLKLASHKESSLDTNVLLHIERQTKELEQAQWAHVHEELGRLSQKVGACCGDVLDLRAKFDSRASSPAKSSTRALEERISRTVVSVARVDDRLENGLAALSADLAAIKDSIIPVENKATVESVACICSKLPELEERYSKLSTVAAQLEDGIGKALMGNCEVNAGLSTEFASVKDKMEKADSELEAAYAAVPGITERYAKLSDIASRLQDRIKKTVQSEAQINASLSAEFATFKTLSGEFAAVKSTLSGEFAAVQDQLSEIQDRYAKLSEVAEQMEDKISSHTNGGDQVYERVLQIVSSELAGVNASCDEKICKMKTSITELEGRINKESASVHAELSGLEARLDGTISSTATSMRQAQENLDDKLAILRGELAGMISGMEDKINKRASSEVASQEIRFLVRDFEKRLASFERSHNGSKTPGRLSDTGPSRKTLPAQRTPQTATVWTPRKHESGSTCGKAWKMQNGKWSRIQEPDEKAQSAPPTVTERLQQQALRLACQSLGGEHAEQIAEFERRFRGQDNAEELDLDQSTRGRALFQSPS